MPDDHPNSPPEKNGAAKPPPSKPPAPRSDAPSRPLGALAAEGPRSERGYASVLPEREVFGQASRRSKTPSVGAGSPSVIISAGQEPRHEEPTVPSLRRQNAAQRAMARTAAAARLANSSEAPTPVEPSRARFERRSRRNGLLLLLVILLLLALLWVAMLLRTDATGTVRAPQPLARTAARPQLAPETIPEPKTVPPAGPVVEEPQVLPLPSAHSPLATSTASASPTGARPVRRAPASSPSSSKPVARPSASSNPLLIFPPE